MVDWDNQHVGLSLLKYARLGRGRRMHLLDTTHIEVALETGTYACRGVVKHEDGTQSRGDKRATLRTLLASAGLLTQGALAAIQVHDIALCRPWLEEAPVVRAGDLRLEAITLRRLVAEYLRQYLTTSTVRPPDSAPTACQYGC